MICIRVDMNETIATGHLMRCFAIAKQISALGEDVVFVCADNNSVNFLTDNGFDVYVLNTTWNNMDDEIDSISEYISNHNVKGLLVDSYYVTKDYLEAIISKTRVFYIDDLNRFPYPVDTVICYANYFKKFNYEEVYGNAVKSGEIKVSPKLLLGYSYVPLRKEFSDCKPKTIGDRIESMLVLSGGTDNYGVLLKLSEKLSESDYKRIVIVCGRYYDGYEALLALYANDSRFEIIKNTDEMKKLMEVADVAISAGGTTLYELCAVGTPTITYSIADNQIDNVKQFDVDGLMKYVGDARYDNIYDGILSFLNIYDNRDVREKMSKEMQSRVDGFGAVRIAKEICV